MVSGANGARHTAAEHLQQQIAEHRRDLARTVSALHDKTDVKARVRDRAAGAEIAVAGVASRAGRTLDALPRFLRWAGNTAEQQAHRLPRPVRTPAEHAAVMLRRRIRLFLAAWTVMVAIMAMRRRLRR